jgi:hypothetical protein
MLPLANGEVRVAVVVVKSWPPTFSCTMLGVMLVVRLVSSNWGEYEVLALLHHLQQLQQPLGRYDQTVLLFEITVGQLSFVF